MDLDIKRIIDLYKIEQRILEIEEEKGDLPKIIDDQEEELEILNQTVSDSDTEIESISKSINSFAEKSKDFNSKIDNLNSQIYSVKNNKEYEAILKEIDFLKSQQDENSTDLSNSNHSKEEISSILETSRNKIDDLKIKIDENRIELKESSVLTEKEELELNDAKQKLLKTIKDKKFVKSFDSGNSEFKLATVTRESCSSCNSSLPPQFMLNVKNMNKLYPCPTCGVNLFWDNE